MVRVDDRRDRGEFRKRTVWTRNYFIFVDIESSPQVASVGNRMESRRYSNLMDLDEGNFRPGRISDSWLDSQQASKDFNLQERRFFKDFR